MRLVVEGNDRMSILIEARCNLLEGFWIHGDRWKFDILVYPAAIKIFRRCQRYLDSCFVNEHKRRECHFALFALARAGDVRMFQQATISLPSTSPFNPDCIRMPVAILRPLFRTEQPQCVRPSPVSSTEFSSFDTMTTLGRLRESQASSKLRTILSPFDFPKVVFLVLHETRVTRREITVGHRGRHLAEVIDCGVIHRLALVYKAFVLDRRNVIVERLSLRYLIV